uniref:Uncharacterized protein n=1 Tax=Oryza punctata TaxID=4537 RepID=A0A0E0L877_ORYPU|nr:hypothetical protein [Oryza punctata]
MDAREEAMARSLLAKLSHSQSPSGFKARWILERVERTKRLLTMVEAVYEELLGFVDSGYSPFTVDELNDIIREVDFVKDTVILPSIQRIYTDLAELLASAPVDYHASVPQDHDNGGSNGTGLRRPEPTPDEVIGGADGTQVQIISRM